MVHIELIREACLKDLERAIRFASGKFERILLKEIDRRKKHG